MDIQQIKNFLDVAETQHVTRSAERLMVSQPALSRSLKAMERECGFELFCKDGRRIRLTAAGDVLRSGLARAVALYDEALAEGKRTASGEASMVRVCAISASKATLDAIAAFSSTHASARFELSSKESSLITQNDVIISPFAVVEAARQTCFSERIFLAVPASRASRAGKSASVHDYADCRFVKLAGSRGFRNACDAACLKVGFAPKFSFESDNPEAARRAVALGLGVEFWPEYTWGRVEKGVELMPLEDAFRRDLHVALTPSGVEKGEARDFFKCMVNMFLKLGLKRVRH